MATSPQDRARADLRAKRKALERARSAWDKAADEATTSAVAAVEAGLSIRKVADELGIVRQQLYNWLKGTGHTRQRRKEKLKP
jgi:transposase-like protein